MSINLSGKTAIAGVGYGQYKRAAAPLPERGVLVRAMRARRLFDCSRENDGAGALLMVSSEMARDLKHKPVKLLSVAQGTRFRSDQGQALQPGGADPGGHRRGAAVREFQRARRGLADRPRVLHL